MSSDNPKTILVIVAHPDDEILGCGGTLALHVANGDSCCILIMAEGLTSRSAKRNSEALRRELEELKDTARQAAKVIGINDVRFGGLPDNRMDSLDLLDIVKIIEEVIVDVKPDIIYTHHYSDLNIDHQLVHLAVMTAARPLPKSTVRKILYFEVPSATGWNTQAPCNMFLPQYYVDLSQIVVEDQTALDIKLKALKIYESEMRPYPHNRSMKSVEYLGYWRGSSVGLLSAEAFQVGRILT